MYFSKKKIVRHSSPDQPNTKTVMQFIDSVSCNVSIVFLVCWLENTPQATERELLCFETEIMNKNKVQRDKKDHW